MLNTVSLRQSLWCCCSAHEQREQTGLSAADRRRVVELKYSLLVSELGGEAVSRAMSRESRERSRLCGVESSSLSVAARCMSVQVVPDRPYRCEADSEEWIDKITNSGCLSRERGRANK